MRNKLSKLIINNIYTNKRELNAIVWRWLAHKTWRLKKNLSLQKDDDFYITLALTKNNEKYNKVLTLLGQKVKTSVHLRKFRRICLVTGRRRGVFRYFGLSRIQLKRAAKLRLVTGLRKSSW